MRSNRLIGIILITCVILLIAIYVFREGYRNTDDSDAAALAAVYESQKNVNDKNHRDFVKSRLQNYNPIGMALTSAGTQGNLGNSTSPLMGTTGNRRGLGGNERVNNLPLSTGKTGMFDIVAKCEAVNTADCSAFNDPDFAKNCGMCLDLGPSEAQATNSNNLPSIGGRYLSSDDREQAEEGVTGDFLPDYTPTFGTCPAPKRMAATKAQCLRIKRQMECEKAANYDKPNCVQCFGDGNYSIVDPALSPRIFTGSGTLVIFGEGIMSFNEIGYQKKERVILSKTNGVRITLEGPEMTRITISVTPVDDSSPAPSIGGYITGVTTSGEFVVDMKRILLDDAATGRKPLTGGSMNVDGMYVAKIVTGFAQTQLALNAQVPFTFVDPLTQEGVKCSSSPYVTTQAAAEFLGSNPCYNKNSGPGKYSLECLQNIFLSNGGLQSGKGYPKDETLASPLMYDSSGKARSLNDIATYIYALSIIAATGVDMYGNKQTIENWSAASVFCTGKEVSTPCDAPGKDVGPLNDECLTYLWDNMGSSNSLGGTYNAISMAKSLFNSGNNTRFCQRSGTMSPVDANGKKNRKAIEYWRQQGGVSAVKDVMKTIHEMANLDYNEISDNDRNIYMNQCYGDNPLAKVTRPPPVIFDAIACPYPSGADVKRLCRKAWPPPPAAPIPVQVLSERYEPSVGDVLAKVIMKKNFRLSLDITPKNIVSNKWGGIIHFSKNGYPCCDPGQSCNGGQTCSLGNRTPAVWFFPNELRLLVAFTTTVNGNLNYVIDGCKLGETNYLVIECVNQTLTLTLNDTSNTYKITGSNYTGPISAYTGVLTTDYYAPALCLVENVQFQTSD